MPVSVARGFESPGRVQDREAQRATSGSDEVRGGVYGGGEPAGHHLGNDGALTTAQMLPVVTDDLAQVPAYAGDVSTGHVTSGQAAASGESETKDGNGVSATSLVAGAAAAATSSVIGGQLGVAGTVLGAGLASVVTAVAVTFYSRGLDKGREKVQKAVAKIGPVPNTKDERTIAIVTEEPLTWRQKLRRKRVLYPVVIGAVSEQVTENDISPGTSQISRTITGDASGGEGTSGTGETGAGETGTGDTGGSTGANAGADRQGTGQQVPADEGGPGTDDGTGDQEGSGEQGTGQDGSGSQGADQDTETGTGQESDSGAGEGSGAGGSSDSGGSSGSGSSDGGSAGSGGSGGGAGGDANSQGGSIESGSGSGSDTSA